MSTEQTKAVKDLLEEYNVEGTLTPTKVNPRRLGTGQCSSSQQDYRQSALSGSKIEQDMDEAEGGLYNPLKPNLAIQHEKPQHVLMVMLKIQGYSNKEIALQCDCTPCWVSQVLRQPWAQKRWLDEIKRSGRDALNAILSGEAADSIWRLVEARDNAPKWSDKINASNSLLDRLLGRPNQPISHSGTVDPTTLSDEDLAKVITQNGVGPT